MKKNKNTLETKKQNEPDLQEHLDAVIWEEHPLFSEWYSLILTIDQSHYLNFCLSFENHVLTKIDPLKNCIKTAPLDITHENNQSYKLNVNKYQEILRELNAKFRDVGQNLDIEIEKFFTKHFDSLKELEILALKQKKLFNTNNFYWKNHFKLDDVKLYNYLFYKKIKDVLVELHNLREKINTELELLEYWIRPYLYW